MCVAVLCCCVFVFVCVCAWLCVRVRVVVCVCVCVRLCVSGNICVGVCPDFVCSRVARACMFDGVPLVCDFCVCV